MCQGSISSPPHQTLVIYFFFNIFIHRLCVGFSLVVASRGYSLAVLGLLVAVASLVVEYRL